MRQLDERVISKAIVSRYMDDLLNYLDNEVSIVGGGPAGLVCSYRLAKSGVKVALFDRRLTIGGGMWGGGMLFNKIVVQEIGKSVFDEVGIGYEEFEDGYYVADSIEATAMLISASVKSGVKIFNGIEVEDVVLKRIEDIYRVSGLVVNWTTVLMANLPVDPLVVSCRYVVDGTGHEAVVTTTLVEKGGVRIDSPTGGIPGEKPLWAEEGEKSAVNDTREIFPGLVVCGMAANNVAGTHRMGPVFGGMLLSGVRASEIILEGLGR